MRRRGREKHTLEIGSSVEGIPVLQSYKYLGLYLDNKLTSKVQIKYIEEKVRFISYKLRPLIDNISAGYRKNLWSTFIRPLFELLAILHVSEPAVSHRLNLDRMYRKSFQKIVRVGRTTPLFVQEVLIGSNLAERENSSGMIMWQDGKRGEKEVRRNSPSLLLRIETT